MIPRWPATLAVVASGGATHRSLRCTAGVSRVEGGQPCKVALTGWPCEPRGLPRNTQLGSVAPLSVLPFSEHVLICHHSGASPVKLSTASQVPPGRGAATAVRRYLKSWPASVCARIWHQNVPVCGAVNSSDPCIASWPRPRE